MEMSNLNACSGTGELIALGFEIVKAFHHRTIIAENITREDTVRYGEWSKSLADRLWTGHHCVIAAPLMNYKNPRSKVIGTISFGTSVNIEDSGFATERVQLLVKCSADTIYRLLGHD